ncbi:MAG: hypothetical protein EZS28_012701, partial [Streblomastix strix]
MSSQDGADVSDESKKPHHHRTMSEETLVEEDQETDASVEDRQSSKILAKLILLGWKEDKTIDLLKEKILFVRGDLINGELSLYQDESTQAIRLGLNPKVSGKHCLIENDQIGWHITDMSTNGTFINEKRITKGVPTSISDGDVISVGKLKKTPGSSSSTADTGTDDASSNFPSQFRFEIPSQDNKKKESVE